MILNSLYSYYNGVGRAGYTNSIPNQAIPESKKTEAWKKKTMDALEQIGLNQLVRNLEFRDYYKMIEGRLVYSDFEAPPELMRDINKIREEIDLPTSLQHYDIIGLIGNQLVGELSNNLDRIRFDCIDEFAENEFIRERTNKINEFLKQSFEFQIQQKMFEMGINPNSNTKFKSEEERQQFEQQLQQIRDSIISPEVIEKELRKGFKSRVIEWAENTYTEDIEKFNIKDLEQTEFLDYYLTGRYFRNYYVGYDYYKPERWSPEVTFFSQDLEIERPQDAEYVGRITWMSASQILSRWGHKLSEKDQVKISKVYDFNTEGVSSNTADYTTIQKRPIEAASVPYGEHFDQQITVQLQEAYGKPFGVTTYKGEDGYLHSVPDWISDYKTTENYFGSYTASILRDDIEVRRDSFRVTESYFRGRKRMGFVRYKTPLGTIAEELVDEKLIKDFLTENNIKELKGVTLEEFDRDKDKLNVIVYFYVPIIYFGVKINSGNGIISDDIYVDVSPLENQIHNNGNLFDVIIPVGGIITNSIARKIRPYQLSYNICMNQIFNLLEKEIGMFFLMDINYLPSEFRNLGDSHEILSELRDYARDLGFIPTDTSLQNLAGRNPGANTLIKQEISYDAQLARRVSTAEFYKRLALEQIGITDQRRGTPNEYQTNEGIRVGQEASYAQTRQIYDKFNKSRKHTIDLHLKIAQQSQIDKKDITVFTRKPDGEIAYINFIDKNFDLRDIGVYTLSDSESRKSLERLRESLLSNNTLNNDILDFANLVNSKSINELILLGKEGRKRQEQLLQEERDHQEKLTRLNIEAEDRRIKERTLIQLKENELNRDTKLEAERIKALGRASDKDSDLVGIREINKAADLALKNKEAEQDFEIKKAEQELSKRDSDFNNKIKIEEIKLKLAELREKREQRLSQERIARENRNRFG